MLDLSTNLRPDGVPLLYRKPQEANQFMRYWMGLEAYHYNQIITQYAYIFAVYNAISIDEPFQVLTESQYYYDWFFNQWFDFDLELCNRNILVNAEYEPRQGIYYQVCQGDVIQMIINKRVENLNLSLRRINFEGSVKKFLEFLFSQHVGRLRTIGWDTFSNLFKECRKEFDKHEVDNFDRNPFNDMLPYFQFM